MLNLYGQRGYQSFTVLLGMQALAFAGLGLMALGGTAALSLPAAIGSWLLVAATALFSLRTWTIVSQAGFCLGLLTWTTALRYQLRPLLLLAPIGCVAEWVLRSSGVAQWVAALPLLLISGLGLLCSAVLLFLVVTLAKRSRLRDERHAQVLAKVHAEHGPDATRRLTDSIDCRRGALDVNPFQMRRGLMLADLPATAWHDPAEFPWVAAFESAGDAIQAEALRACGGASGLAAYQYPGAVQGNWNVFWLVRNNQLTPEAEAMCPATVAALRQVTGFPFMREAHFSILQPHSRIRPHCDESNTWVTGHFGISVPAQCGIRVGRERRRWEEKKFLFFDTSYEHEAWNDSDSPRIVLLFDFLHPRLSTAERDFLMQLRGKAA
ncbi:aspartyl/asparaginyl beta-hydroxylase domain-containing protein [Massilia sp. YMA4]|uniref:aspartyl/asparaginyl beta-hydroxylase domain-containing protein n=1 Tax=Massilia sp. YMA4 TaxID=1593482 RepID=UPI001877CD8C|nr:aspartyl/asparaginyl beta-hydroxylase domain-containing protein [Massilia sp. YMA4]